MLVVIIQTFFNTHCNGLHIATGQAAIRMQSFVHHHKISGFFKYFPLIGCHKTTNVNECIFLGAHGGAIGQCKQISFTISRILLLRIASFHVAG
jgi:hypothetical protein